MSLLDYAKQSWLFHYETLTTVSISFVMVNFKIITRINIRRIKIRRNKQIVVTFFCYIFLKNKISFLRRETCNIKFRSSWFFVVFSGKGNEVSWLIVVDNLCAKSLELGTSKNHWFSLFFWERSYKCVMSQTTQYKKKKILQPPVKTIV